MTFKDILRIENLWNQCCIRRTESWTLRAN